MPLSVFATIRPKPAHVDDAREAILSILAETRAEPGCRTFTLHEAREGGATLHLFEVWDDEAALEAHYAQPYTRRVFEAYEGWLASPPEVVRMSPLG